MKVLAIIALVILLGACSNKDWRTASRESAGLALNPVTDTQASIEVYAADAFSWRGCLVFSQRWQPAIYPPTNNFIHCIFRVVFLLNS